MKRILFFLLAALLVVGGGLGLIFWSDTPEKALKDGLTRLIAMRGARVVKLDVSWTDTKSKQTTGFTFTGPLDLRDPVLPNISGLLRVGAGTAGLADQTGDIVAAGDQVALRPRSVGPEWRASYQTLVGVTTTKPYVRFDRAILLDSLDHPGVMTTSKGEDVRAAFAYIIPLAVPTGPLMRAQSSIGPLAVVDFKIDRSGLNPFLNSLLRAWYGRNPTVEELGIIDQLIQSAGKGSYRIAIDEKTRMPVEISGQFGLVDDLGKPKPLTVRFTLGIQGLNEVQSIVMPEGTVDAAIGMQGAKASASLPSSQMATGSNIGLDIGAQPTFGEIVGNKQIDLYQNYLDTLKKKRPTSIRKR